MEKIESKNRPVAETREGAEAAIVSLTALETEIMQVVWERGSVSASEVREAMFPYRPLAHTTILTVLEKLRRKKAVKVVPSLSRSKRFRATVEKQAIASDLLGKLRSRFFGGSTASLVAQLVNENAIDDQELEAIRRMLDGKN